MTVLAAQKEKTPHVIGSIGVHDGDLAGGVCGTANPDAGKRWSARLLIGLQLLLQRSDGRRHVLAGSRPTA